jgi:hypothetical protein
MPGWITSVLKIGELVFSLIWRRAQKKDDPNEQNLKRKADADRAVAELDADAVNRQLDDNEQRLRNQTNGHTGG